MLTALMFPAQDQSSIRISFRSYIFDGNGDSVVKKAEALNRPVIYVQLREMVKPAGSRFQTVSHGGTNRLREPSRSS